MSQTVSSDVADRIRAFAWRIRPTFGPDGIEDAAHNVRGLGDTMAMIVAAGHRSHLGKGSEATYARFDAHRSRTALIRLRTLLRNRSPSGPSRDPASFIEVAPGVHVWIAPDGTIIAGPMERGSFHESAVTIRETGRGDWIIETRPAIADARRVEVAGMIADRLADLLAPIKGRVAQSCRPGGVAFTVDRRIDRRWCDTGRMDDRIIGELAVRHEPDALKEEVDALVADVRRVHARYERRMADMRDIAREIEEAMAAERLHTRVHILEDSNSWTLTATHLGMPLGGVFFPSCTATSLTDLERHLGIGLKRALAGDIGTLRRYLPENVRVGGGEIDATLMNLIRTETSDAVEADAVMRRIIKQGQRQWSARDLGDLFGHPVDATLATSTTRQGTFGATIKLSDEVTMKNGTLVIRRSQLPRTIADTLAGRRLRDVVGHPWLPDTTILRTTSATATVGDTYSLVLEKPYERIPAIARAA